MSDEIGQMRRCVQRDHQVRPGNERQGEWKGEGVCVCVCVGVCGS